VLSVPSCREVQGFGAPVIAPSSLAPDKLKISSYFPIFSAKLWQKLWN
jgi:hypothetical protein